MAFRRNLLLLSFVLLLGSCAYAVESSNQYITFLTPDAQDAKCYVYVDKLKYQVFPPQSINIKKSPKDMEITCNAPGNRMVETSVPAQMSKRAAWGGPAGMAWDYASNSLFYYPSVIAIDFSHEELKPNKLPRHNNSDIRQPESYDLEEFRPAQPRLNSDKEKINLPILRRGEDFSEEVLEEIKKTGESTESEQTAVNSEDTTEESVPANSTSDENSDFQSVIDGLTETTNLTETPALLAEEALAAPVPLYAGE